MRSFPSLVLVAILSAFPSPMHAAAPDVETPQPKKIAAIVTAYYHNSHADVLVSRLLETDTLDGKGRRPRLALVSLYTDQVPANDISRKLMAAHRIPIHKTVEDALTLGTGKLAVDGVMLVAEHGDYPRSDTTQIEYPKRRLFEQVIRVFEKSGRVVPIFVDKHLADNWTDAKWIHDTAQRLKIPLMAGSSLPVLWRRPAEDITPGDEPTEIVAVSYHTLDAYGFHALEMVQTLAEHRRGGETGIASVQCRVDEEVWKAGESGVYSRELLDAALARLKNPPPKDRPLRELVPHPVLFIVDYADGLRARVLTLNGAVGEWAAAWKEKKRDGIRSTLFWTQEARPFMHFAHQLDGIEAMMHTGRPAWPSERTLMTSGALDALLISKRDGGKRVETPHLKFPYKSDWTWKQPADPPADRPIDGP